MLINDDILSAFLDGELPAQDLQTVRVALARDPVLAARLEALKLANALVAQHALALDATPLPATVLDLLNADERAQPVTATLLPGPWQRWRRHTTAVLALAASLVLTLGVAVNYLTRPAAGDLPALAAYSGNLDNSPSGITVTADGVTILNRFSFRNHENQYCRQYQLRTDVASAENVACRNGSDWTLVASLPAPVESATNVYQPAGSSAELNTLLDTMMQGAALDLATEAELIGRDWQDAATE